MIVADPHTGIGIRHNLSDETLVTMLMGEGLKRWGEILREQAAGKLRKSSESGLVMADGSPAFIDPAPQQPPSEVEIANFHVMAEPSPVMQPEPVMAGHADELHARDFECPEEG